MINVVNSDELRSIDKVENHELLSDLKNYVSLHGARDYDSINEYFNAIAEDYINNLSDEDKINYLIYENVSEVGDLTSLIQYAYSRYNEDICYENKEDIILSESIINLVNSYDFNRENVPEILRNMSEKGEITQGFKDILEGVISEDGEDKTIKEILDEAVDRYIKDFSDVPEDINDVDVYTTEDIDTPEPWNGLSLGLEESFSDIMQNDINELIYVNEIIKWGSEHIDEVNEAISETSYYSSLQDFADSNYNAMMEGVEHDISGFSASDVAKHIFVEMYKEQFGDYISIDLLDKCSADLSIYEMQNIINEAKPIKLPNVEFVDSRTIKVSARDGVDYIPNYLLNETDYVDGERVGIYNGKPYDKVIIDDSIKAIHDYNINGALKYLHLPQDITVTHGLADNIDRMSLQGFDINIGDKTINSKIIDNFYGYNAIYKLKIISTAIDNNIPITDGNMRNLNNIIHKLGNTLTASAPVVTELIGNFYNKYGFSLDYDDLSKFLTDFRSQNSVYSLTEIVSLDTFKEQANKYIEENTRNNPAFKELEDKFKEKFNGHTPRIMDSIAYASIHNNVSPDKIIDNFDYKRVSSFVNNNIPQIYGITLMANLSKNDFDKAIKNQYVKEISDLLSVNDENRNKAVNTAQWIINHPDANVRTVEDLVKAYTNISITKDTPTRVLMDKIEKSKSAFEIINIENKYDKFRFADVKCNLDRNEVDLGKYKAYIMDAKDPQQVMLGYLTNCCQHLGGAGETAMMYGLINPDAGFLVIEDKETGKIMAQAEVWETDNFKMENVTSNERIANMLDTAVSNGYIKLEDITKCFTEENYVEGVGTVYSDNLDDVNSLVVKDGHITSVDAYNSDLLRYIGHPDDDLRNGFDKYCKDYGIKIDITPYGEIVENRGGNYQSILVLDNIEFADDRQIDQFAPILAKWCEKSDYDNIIMGNGYNEMQSNDLRQIGGVEMPLDEDIITTVADEQLIGNIMMGDCMKINEDGEMLTDLYGSPSDFFEALSNRDSGALEIIEYWGFERTDIEPYTDANRSCSLLKVDGKIEPYLEKAYAPLREQDKKLSPYQARYMNNLQNNIDREDKAKNNDINI